MRYAYITCPCGQLQGIGTDTYEHFKGIPYAHADRWEAPRDVTGWKGLLDATVQGKACPQANAFVPPSTGTAIFYRSEMVEKQVIIYSEDCLNLNIWRPTEGQQLPVLVYIHGGSYETGSGCMKGFNSDAYCRRGVILVTINYRLNAFAGAIGPGYSGNYGLQDQLSALRWVQRNIAAFGGDPEKVTIMGESAGAMSVQNLVLSPMAAGLFRGAIMLSGGGILPRSFRLRKPEAMQALWQEIVEDFGVASIDELKQIPPQALYLTWKRISGKNPRYAAPATPVIDGHFLPDDPQVMVQTGAVNRVPTILSVLSEDMWPHTLYQAILDWAAAVTPHGMPVYGAYFDRAVPGSDHGAYHGCDVKYAFDTLHLSWRPYTDVDRRISRDMIDYFAGFAKTGIPQAEGLAAWLPLSEQQQRFMHFGDEPCAMTPVPPERLQATEATGKPFPTI